MATQPGTGLAVFDPKAGAPAHVAHFFEDQGTNITARTTVPSLSPEGKVWTISLNGQKIPLQRRNQDNDLEPLPIMKAVVLDYAKQRGRAYYEGDYDPNKVSAPICWSDDGVAPDASLPGPFPAGTAVEPGKSRKIHADCANCPMAVKGSKVDNRGKAMTACSQHRMLAIIPDPALGLKDIPPLRLKIAITSDWDAQSPDQEAQGWLAFSKYTDWLNARGVAHTAALVTKMKFDPEAAYPKIFFSAERYLEPQELAVIGPLVKSEEVKKLLGGTWTPAGVDGVPRDQQAVATPQADPVAPVAPVAQTIAPAAAPPVEYVMAAGETFTREQYHTSGWTDDQLLAAGKMMVKQHAAPAPAPAVEVAPIVVGEAVAATATVAAGSTETPSSVPAAVAPKAEAIVIGETAAPSPTLSAPAAEVHQEAAQAATPAPAPIAPAPEPPAAAAAAAEVSADVSTDVSPELAGLLNEWS